jgi:serine/threonine protein kinase
MNTCPTQETLRSFLEEDLEEPRRHEVMAHLESCLRCQALLHGIVFETGRGEPDRDPRLGHPETQNDREIIDALAKKVPTRPGCSISDGHRARIEFPAPGTDWGALGRLDDYHIQEELGSGTYGVVFKAYQQKLERIVSLKILRPELADLPGARRRFEREARAAAKLNNPHVVVIHAVVDATKDFPLPFIAMEFVEGMSLHELIRAHPRGLDQALAVRLAQQVARGLAAAHGHGIVHRDVKPENVLLREDKSGWHAKITDFGIAQVLETAQRKLPFGSIIGTPSYMSPEAFRAPEKVDSRSDLYSLGVTLYQLLTGRLPAQSGCVEARGRRDVESRVDPLRRLNPEVRPDLEAIVLKCLAFEPEGRYETAAELAEQLERWLNNEPVGAWRYSPAERMSLWYRRNRWLAAFLAATTFLVLILGLWLQSDLALRRREAMSRMRAVDEYWNTAETQQKMGHFGEATATLENSMGLLEGRPDLSAQRRRVEGRIALLRRLDEFMQNSDRAWFSAGEEQAVATRVACEKALGCYNVLGQPGWYAVPPASELPDNTAALVRGEAHRLLVLMAAMRIKDGIMSFVRLQFQVVEDAMNTAQTALERARELERLGVVAPSRTVALLEKGTHRLLVFSRQTGFPKRPPDPPEEPATPGLVDELTAEDGFFLGVMQVYFAKHQNDPLAMVIRRLGPREFDYQRPRDTAAEMLRLAVQLEPRQYWSSFMLGRVLLFPGPDGKADLHEALQAFNMCVSLRPDYSRGYEQRALTLVQLSLEAPALLRRDRLQRDAAGDLAKANDLAADDPSTHWVRGQAFVLMGETTKALTAFIRALELEHDFQEKVSRRNQLDIPRRLVEKVLEKNRGEGTALRLAELIERVSKP